MNGTLPIATPELALRVESAEHVGLIKRLEAFQTDASKRDGVGLKSFGSGTALIYKESPAGFFNKVIGLTEADVHLLPEILEFYAAYDVVCRVKTNPVLATPNLLAALTEHGFVVEEFATSSMYGLATEEIPPLPDGITVQKLTIEEIEQFAELYTQAMGLAPERAASLAHNNRLIAANNSDYHYYIAAADGVPASVAMMFLHDGMGSFCAAATLPEYRGRGLQQALIYQRIQDAARMGCDLVVGQAAYNSSSQRNMLRSGMGVAFSDLVFIKQ
ncbi:hypothetical protein CBW65_08810 [Tumebacillus avium]|uniref:N-acetyltransferase domain-containing protein n=1 Tax=Tumebacillus avium TaxID=1903704 RepID=A0A1Y0ILH0_9BACL|nr:GNAT family N-acetyltransferase [Tumebacillus avium]ARU61120.1 hypothetical protein CBW65_08810 [Tumebacillus avium]